MRLTRTTAARSVGRGVVPALAAAVLQAVLLAAPLGAQERERHTLRGSDVAVYNLVGELRLEAGSGSEVVVEVARGGRDAASLRVQTGRIRDRETLRVIYPDDRIVYPDGDRGSRDEISVRDDGTFGDHDRWGGGRRVTIARSGGGLEAHADLIVRVPKGQRISVYLGAGEASVTNVDGDVVVDVSSASVTTRGTRGRLLLDTGSGEVSVSDADGEVDLDTGSGGVRLANIKGRRLRVDAGSGSLTGDGIAVPSLSLDLGSGGTRLSGVSAEDLDIDSGSGSVDVALVSDVRSLVVDSGSGSVTLRVPSSLGASIDIETGSGGVDTEVPIAVTRRSGSRLVGTIGDGNGRIRIDSGSGEVRIVRGMRD
jgi:lia operon protein LiaG